MELWVVKKKRKRKKGSWLSFRVTSSTLKFLNAQLTHRLPQNDRSTVQ
jgi:hypothetical protein